MTSEAKPDAWLYEGKVMVYKEKHQRIDLVSKGYKETPLFYKKGKQP